MIDRDRHTETHGDIQRHTVTQRHIVTHRDTQWENVQMGFCDNVLTDCLLSLALLSPLPVLFLFLFKHGNLGNSKEEMGFLVTA